LATPSNRHFFAVLKNYLEERQKYPCVTLSNIAHRVYMPTHLHSRHAPAIKILSIVNYMLPTVPPPDANTLVYKYKLVAKKVKPIAGTLHEDF
jgi:hypothetical protein